MAYDAARGVVVLFGGTDNASALADTWTWDGQSWKEVTPAGTSPSARFNIQMTYDAKRKRVVLYGGQTLGGVLSDTWEWDGAQWSDVTPKSGHGPKQRCYHALTYDAKRGRVLLFGGSDDKPALGVLFNDLWRWDGTAWSEVKLTGKLPGKRAGHGLAYDVGRDRVVLYGGNDGSGIASDLWELVAP
jgi:hypothetical protein